MPQRGGAELPPRQPQDSGRRWVVVRLLLAGIRVRLRSYVALLVVVALTVGAAAAGAIWARAAQETVLQDTLTSVSQGRTDFRVRLRSSAADALVGPDLLGLRLAAAPAAGSIRGYPKRILQLSRPTAVTISALFPQKAMTLTYREGACAHLVVAGRCPQRPGEALVSVPDAAANGAEWNRHGGFRTADGTALRVVGTYGPKAAAARFWGASDYFANAVGSDDDQPVIGLKPVFVAKQQFTGEDARPFRASLEYPLDIARIRLDDLAPVLLSIDAARRTLDPGKDALSSRLRSVVSEAEQQGRYVDQAASVVALQLVLLGAVVVFALVSALVESRRREIALAKLRGQRTAAVLRFALGETLVVLLAGLPLGLLLAFVVNAALARVALLPGTPVTVPADAGITAVVALVGTTVAAVVATQRVLSRPILEQWRRTADDSTSRPVARVVRWAVAAVGITAAVLVLVLRQSGPLVMVVPGLVIAAAALLCGDLLASTARLLAPRSRRSSRIGPYLAVRRLARGRTTTRSFVLLVVTLGLACFASGGQSVLEGNRAARAAAEIGATQAVPVLGSRSDVIEAVRRADPDGRWAAAAATWLPDGGGSVVGTVLAVDASRLAAVAQTVRGGRSGAALQAELQTSLPPATTFRGSRLTADITADSLRGGAASVEFLLRHADGSTVQADAGSLRSGAAHYSAAVPCASGCELQEIHWTRPAPADGRVSGHVRLTALHADNAGAVTRLAARVDDPRAWRAAVPVSESHDAVSVGPSGVSDVFRSDSGYGGIERATTPRVLPAVVTERALVSTEPNGGWAVQDFNGTTVRFRVAATVNVLPAVLNRGVLLDASALERESPAFASEASWQVWLAPTAPTDAVQRLDRAGLTTGAVSSISQRAALLARGGPALAMTLLSVLAAAAALLAVGALFVTAATTATERSYEFAAMRLLGVTARQLAIAEAVEQCVTVLAAGLVGVPAGVLTGVFVLPAIREFPTPTPVPLTFVPRPEPVALLAAAIVVLAAAVGLLGAALTVRLSRPSRLRGSEL